MEKKSWFDSGRLEVIVAILIALVSLTTALVVWRINVVGSNSDDIVHTGLIDAIKKQTYANEDWRKLYEEATYARDYSIYLAGVRAMENSENTAQSAQAANLRQYLLPSLQLLSSPLGTESKYLKADGSYDLDKRYADLEGDTTEFSTLDPQGKFDLAKSYFSQKRWESIGLILLAVSLLWLTLSEITSKWMTSVTLLLGLGIYMAGLIWFIAVEGLFFLSRGGAL
ncbi:MAG: hypothetical protein A2X27_10560 [Chloroflexi bacterium GWD2_49_16]|nr:MAG: hypothetical protein A2X27_10560 [Chloroflexi bacterium GWD2_49_16]